MLAADGGCVVSGWLPYLSVGVAVLVAVFSWLTLRINAAKFHRENEPELQVEAHWMNRSIPHVSIEHKGPTLDRIDLEVLGERAGTKRAGLLMETGQGRAVNTYTLRGPIQQGTQELVRVALDPKGRGREMRLRVTSYPQGSGVWWRRWLCIGQRNWVDMSTVVFPLPPRISTADMSSRIPTQAEVRRQQGQ